MRSVDELQATRQSDIVVDARRMQKFDEMCVWSSWQNGKLISPVAVMVILGVLLICMGRWWGGACLAVAMLAIWISHRSAKGISRRIYQEGQLVPAIVVQLHPIELLALADMTIPGGSSRAHGVHWAYKRFRVKRLPLHELRVGERVPCVASFQLRESGVFANFTPRPLAWATGDATVIEQNIARIDEGEWKLLTQIASERTCLEEGVVRIETEGSAGDQGQAVMRMFRYRCIGLSHPAGWLVKGEDLKHGAYYVECEAEGDEASGLALVTAVPYGDAPAEYLQWRLRKLREQPTHEDLEVQETGTTNYRGYTAHYCTFTLMPDGIQLYGRIYTFQAADYSVSIVMQDSVDQFDEKFAFLRSSLQVFGRVTTEY